MSKQLKIHLLSPVNHLSWLAVSGGRDSMACLDFLRRCHAPRVVYFNHSTDHGEDAEEFMSDFCADQGLDLKIGRTSRSKLSDESWEEYWRNQRYDFFGTLPGIGATCHHLNDVAETWLFSMANGQPKCIPYKRGTSNHKYICRPFLPTEQAALTLWAENNDVPYIEDPSNENTRYARVRIRKKILPEVLEVNPGFLKVIRRQLMEEIDDA